MKNTFKLKAIYKIAVMRSIAIIIMVAAIWFTMTTCESDSSSKEKTEVDLAVPVLTINQVTKTASWTAVANANTANGYTIKIGTEETQVTGLSYSLSNLAIGTYQISVKSNGYETDTHIFKASTYSAAQSFIVVSIVDMVWIPGGNFIMGSDDNQDYYASPPHQVTLTGFYMGKYEVTQAQWETVMEMTIDELLSPLGMQSLTSYGRGDDYPVYYVNWYEALMFCNKLSIKDGLTPAYRMNNSTNPDDWSSDEKGMSIVLYDETWDVVEIVSGSTGYRLPTEAQWEYACRAGTKTPWYCDESELGDYAWYSQNSGWGADDSGSKAVGTKAPNSFGLYDMHGNVSEWCWDWEGSYQDEAQTDPQGASPNSIDNNSRRMLRGGSWKDSAIAVRSMYRGSYAPSSGCTFDIGFRIVRP